ncbi:MAG: DJ-1/PfpI family protein [Breznakibacter sp.]|nr:DJ-1/PfpI family protein [Breznakibacter sp.]
MKNRAFVFLCDGFEEIEAITPIDILRRGGVEVTTISVNNTLKAIGAHNITVECDANLSQIDLNNGDIYILPGGPGHKALAQNEIITNQLLKANQENKLIAAICASPSILGKLGLLVGKKACCFTGFEEQLSCKTIVMNEPTVTDGNIITSRGAGTAFSFGIAIINKVFGADKGKKLEDQMIYMK